MSEKEYSKQIEHLFKLFGWRYSHFRPAWTTKGWRTAISGNAGFPDYVMVKGGRLIFAEIKSGGNKPSLEQWEWLEALGRAGAEVYLWHEGEDTLESIAEILRDKKEC